jgi:L-aspartate oxidase
MDMEFFQFHPTGLAVEANPRFLISEAVRGEGALLLDAQGERFMPRYHALAELAPRDVVARAIVAELQRSGEAHVWLDARRLTSGPSRLRFPTIHAHCLRLGVDMDKDLIPVTPVAHYCMGGIRADTLARTTLPGLLACGETACSGTHGANRLASNSLLESLVFAGRAADFLLGWDGQSWHTDLLEPFGPRSDGGAVAACLAETWEPHGKPVGDDAPSPVAAATQAGVKALMWRDFGLVREAETMARGRRELDALAERFCLSGELRGGGQAALEAKNMLLAGMTVAASAAARRESRGAHYRADHPHPDPGLESHTAAGLAGGRLELARVPLENTEV